MEITQVLHRPVLTEKTNILQSSNTYTWEVDWAANKYQIKEAIEFIFKVKVVKVNILKVDKKPKRVGRYNGFTNRYKKAMITLAEGDKIVYYPNEAEAQDAKKEAKVKAKKAEDKKQAAAKEAEIAKKLAAKKAKAAESKKADSSKAEKTTKSTTSKPAAKKVAAAKKSSK
ncbi:50S ribosomal protein L23 [Mycoplasmopsis fermentans]|nr:50S ribosomal protein L23 [Mycoplasmopsis fermentans]VEU67143.1 50S ribosomal protein L23 [Mesomycoplasma conjunctivae]ADN69140.1 50S ribosomal protein L23 [Mycoplasmopsis fermentans JER]ADV34663.1 Putative 50S ribosomal protein L23 [Mycoplasmopsis fermentans M64]RMX35126.1 50S ribosomal L23 domain protein [Mycoplasmopsis fermentans MF-I1]RMX35181.1 50S ribosomal L23 domain protein [Mycoplasmopsis fermentans MF-I2]